MSYKPDVPCSRCGKLLYSAPGSLPAEQRMCRPCRRSRPGAKPYRRNTTGLCSHCGGPVGLDRYGRPPMTCSPACAKAAVSASICKARATPRPARSCTDCGEPGSGDGPVPLCRPCASRRRTGYWQQKNRRRRAQKRGGASEPYTLAEIAARDRKRCGLCRKPVAMTKKVPHPKAPVVDHVVPIVDGGDDTRANVQLAHFLCNSRKGARAVNEQLALFG